MERGSYCEEESTTELELTGTNRNSTHATEEVHQVSSTGHNYSHFQNAPLTTVKTSTGFLHLSTTASFLQKCPSFLLVFLL